MSRARTARRIATAAAYGGGVGLLGVGMYGLLMAEASWARKVIQPLPYGGPPSADGVYGADLPGEPLVLAVLGDSTSVGYGVERVEDTPGAVLAGGLSKQVRRPVRVVSAGVIGAVSADLAVQVERVLPDRPDVAMILIGGNDVTTRARTAEAVGHLDQAVRALAAVGCRSVVGTCPDLGTIEPIYPPLRWVARLDSRRLAAAQTIAVVEAGGRTVSLGDLLGPQFVRARDRMFSPDRFHPSAEGYALAVAAMLPAVVASVLGTEPAADGVMPLPKAAVQAVATAGTEVSGAGVAGSDDRRDLWGQLRQRIRLPRFGSAATPAPEAARV
ncbi:SGNH/GDSL hydrolase family protein [Fodinicola acaciae]|uniref:SGNH/GDSL hydrolase family protein n=1 Tax=Fodinicola acaciae TaxID=2681555 RepID=UPI001C9E8B98|nr:SGNH/GDSL hydrolase family protein [Fodinicola acaciae]